jgi:hypothetical protein
MSNSSYPANISNGRFSTEGEKPVIDYIAEKVENFVVNQVVKGALELTASSKLGQGDTGTKLGMIIATHIATSLPIININGSKSFYTVQNSEDGARLLSDGRPWPTEPHKANLGEGVYSWDNLDDAKNYLNLKQRRADEDLNIHEFKVYYKELAKMKSLDMTKLSDEQVDEFLDKYAKLNGGTPNHGFEYIRRGTNIGVENYFSSSVFEYLKFTK